MSKNLTHRFLARLCHLFGYTTPKQKALDYAIKYGGIDGAHHKDWVIDQMVRALTGCPVEIVETSRAGEPFSYERQGESDEYAKLVTDACDGEDGPETYGWDEGIAP